MCGNMLAIPRFWARSIYLLKSGGYRIQELGAKPCGEITSPFFGARTLDKQNWQLNARAYSILDQRENAIYPDCF